MKKVILILLSLTGLIASAQNITKIEYSINEFVQEGNGTLNSLAGTATEIDLSQEINIEGLSEGVHTIYIRALNEDGIWSLPVQRSFCINNKSSTNIERVYYRVYNDTYQSSWEHFVIEPQRKNVDSLIAVSTLSMDVNKNYSFEFYAVNTSGTRGFSAFMDNIVFTPTGIEDSKLSEVRFNIYPNPADNYVKIEKSLNDNLRYNYKLYNLQGQILLHRCNSMPNQTLDLSGYPKGVYILTIENKNCSIKKQVLIQ